MRSAIIVGQENSRKNLLVCVAVEGKWKSLIYPNRQNRWSLCWMVHLPTRNISKAISRYNSCFQMTSFGAEEVRLPGYFPTFKVCGQIDHRAGAILPQPGEEPKFLQIYFMGDHNQELNVGVALLKMSLSSWFWTCKRCCMKQQHRKKFQNSFRTGSQWRHEGCNSCW